MKISQLKRINEEGKRKIKMQADADKIEKRTNVYALRMRSNLERYVAMIDMYME